MEARRRRSGTDENSMMRSWSSVGISKKEVAGNGRSQYNWRAPGSPTEQRTLRNTKYEEKALLNARRNEEEEAKYGGIESKRNEEEASSVSHGWDVSDEIWGGRRKEAFIRKTGAPRFRDIAVGSWGLQFRTQSHGSLEQEIRGRWA